MFHCHNRTRAVFRPSGAPVRVISARSFTTQPPCASSLGVATLAAREVGISVNGRPFDSAAGPLNDRQRTRACAGMRTKLNRRRYFDRGKVALRVLARHPGLFGERGLTDCCGLSRDSLQFARNRALMIASLDAIEKSTLASYSTHN